MAHLETVKPATRVAKVARDTWDGLDHLWNLGHWLYI